MTRAYEHPSKIQLAICTHLPPAGRSVAEIANACGATGIDFAVTYQNIGDLEQVIVDCCGPDRPYDLRFHAYFADIEIGSADATQAAKSLEFMRRVVANVAAVSGRYLTVHLGFDSGLHGAIDIGGTIEGLKTLVAYAGDFGVTICVENLRRGLTARPEDFVKLVEESGASVTFDVGHFLSSEAGSNGYHVEDIVARLGDRISAAHIYEAEVDGIGHVSPVNLSKIKPALDALSNTACLWWVAELGDPGEICHTIGLLREYRQLLVS